jgi:hypothetical protein
MNDVGGGQKEENFVCLFFIVIIYNLLWYKS